MPFKDKIAQCLPLRMTGPTSPKKLFALYPLVLDANLILDVGCGPGYCLEILEGMGKEVIGIDLLTFKTYVSKRQIRANAIHMPFRKCIFDAILAFEILEHFTYENGALLLKECFRLLKNGGFLIISTPNLLSVTKLLYLFRRKKWHGLCDPSHKQLYTPFLLRRTLSRIGFKQIQIVNSIMEIFPWRITCNILTHLPPIVDIVAWCQK